MSGERYVNVIDQFLAARSQWMREHGMVAPTSVFVSPMVHVRLMDMATEYVQAGWPSAPALIGRALGCAWYHDRRMTGENFRFEA